MKKSEVIKGLKEGKLHIYSDVPNYTFLKEILSEAFPTCAWNNTTDLYSTGMRYHVEFGNPCSDNWSRYDTMTYHSEETVFLSEIEDDLIYRYTTKAEFNRFAKQLIDGKGFKHFSFKENGYGSFTTGTDFYEFFKEAGVLNLWFDKKLIEEPKKTVIIRVGDTNQEIEINDRICAAGESIEIEELTSTILYFSSIFSSSSTISKWNAKIILDVENHRIIKIGCTNFSLRELKQIVEEYSKWNEK